MPNVLTPFIPNLFQTIEEKSRELVGFIPSVARNTSGERAAVDEAIKILITPEMAASNFTPSMTPATPPDFTLGEVEMKITKSRVVRFAFTGEETKGLDNSVGYQSVFAGNVAEAIRTLTNEMEADIALEAALNASRAIGTTANPFASNHNETADLKKLLDDNGAPLAGRSLILNTSAGANLRKLTNITRVNEAGSSMSLRDGELLNLNAFSIKETAQIVAPVIGTAAATADINTAGYAVGATVIGLAAAGTGTILAGDYVTFAGDTNQYLVVSGDANVTDGGSITISAPGIRVPITTTAAQTVTVVGRTSRNIAFSQNAIQLITRAPALPGGRDLAVDSMMVTDPRSGITYEIRIYLGEGMMSAKVGLAWGVKVINRRHVGALLGAPTN